MLIYLKLASHVKLWTLRPSLGIWFPLTDVSGTIHSLYQDKLKRVLLTTHLNLRAQGFQRFDCWDVNNKCQWTITWWRIWHPGLLGLITFDINYSSRISSKPICNLPPWQPDTCWGALTRSAPQCESSTSQLTRLDPSRGHPRHIQQVEEHYHRTRAGQGRAGQARACPSIDG